MNHLSVSMCMALTNFSIRTLANKEKSHSRAILHPPTLLFYFSPLCIFLGKKILLRESCRKFPADSALENFPQDLIWFCCALHPKVYRLCICSVSVSLKVHCSLWLLICLIIHLQLQQLFGCSDQVFTFSNHTTHLLRWPLLLILIRRVIIDWIRLHMPLLIFVDISGTEYFKDKILLSFWMMLRCKQNCYIW